MYAGGQKIDLGTLTLNTKNALGTVKVDGKNVAFKQEGTKVTLTDQPKQDKPVNDAHPGNGFGGGGGGGTVRRQRQRLHQAMGRKPHRRQ